VLTAWRSQCRSSGMWRRVELVDTNVSEELAASFFSNKDLRNNDMYNVSSNGRWTTYWPSSSRTVSWFVSRIFASRTTNAPYSQNERLAYWRFTYEILPKAEGVYQCVITDTAWSRHKSPASPVFYSFKSVRNKEIFQVGSKITSSGWMSSEE
jgi:hypothetical protein